MLCFLGQKCAAVHRDPQARPGSPSPLLCSNFNAFSEWEPGETQKTQSEEATDQGYQKYIFGFVPPLQWQVTSTRNKSIEAKLQDGGLSLKRRQVKDVCARRGRGRHRRKNFSDFPKLILSEKLNNRSFFFFFFLTQQIASNRGMEIVYLLRRKGRWRESASTRHLGKHRGWKLTMMQRRLGEAETTDGGRRGQRANRQENGVLARWLLLPAVENRENSRAWHALNNASAPPLSVAGQIYGRGEHWFFAPWHCWKYE